MKTFRFIGMALLAVVMSVNLTSCSDDDEPSKNDDGIHYQSETADAN